MSDEQKRALAARLSLLLSGDATLIRTAFARNTLREAIAVLAPKSATVPAGEPQDDLFGC